MRRSLLITGLIAALGLAVLAAPGSAAKKKSPFHGCKSPGPVEQVDESGNKVHFQVGGLNAVRSIKCKRAQKVATKYVTSEACAADCKISGLSCTLRSGKRDGYVCLFGKGPRRGHDAIRFQIVDSGQ